VESRNVEAFEGFEAAGRSDPREEAPATPDLTVIAEDDPTADQAAPAEELLTGAGAAQRFVVTESKLRRQLAAGALEGATKADGPRGSHWVVPAASLVAAGYPERDGWVPDRLATIDGSVLSALVDSVAELTDVVERGCRLIADELARSRAEVEHLRSQADLDRLRIDDLRAVEEPSPRRRFGRPG